jgi:hypothetical protein
MDLDEIGLRHGTDKASATHDYLRLYQRRFEHLRERAFTMIEVGVFKGASLRTWAEFFPHAKVVGLDITEECRAYEHANAFVRIGDASNSSFMFDVIAEFGKPLLVLDDGSHRWDHQILTLNLLFPMLVPGGFYVMEDIDTSFQAHLAQAAYQGLSPISAFDYLAKLARCVTAEAALGSEAPYDLFMQTYQSAIGSVEFGRRTCILSKKPAPGGGPI